MRILFTVLYSFFISTEIYAATNLSGKVHDIDLGNQPGEDVLVFLSTGDVLTLGDWNLKLIEELKAARSSEKLMNFTVSEERVILKAATSTAVPAVTAVPNFDSKSLKSFNNVEYIPTTIASMELATAYLREGRQNSDSESQCFNRAMVWTYEWWVKHSLRSNKVFVFWTKEYVRERKFKWWFHVAPYVHVLDRDGIVKERVMDVKWLKKPYQFQDWANYHSSHDVNCKVVDKYSDFANYPFGIEHCYFIRTNMYTWQPADLEMMEVWGYRKDAFKMDEVRAAYLEAFNLEY